jgi:hypothetical protein
LAKAELEDSPGVSEGRSNTGKPIPTGELVDSRGTKQVVIIDTMGCKKDPEGKGINAEKSLLKRTGTNHE